MSRHREDGRTALEANASDTLRILTLPRWDHGTTRRSESPELDPEEVARNEAEKAELRQEMYAAEVQREQLETQ